MTQSVPTLEEARAAAEVLNCKSVKEAIRKDLRHLQRIASGESDLYSQDEVEAAKIILDYKTLTRQRWKGD